MILASGTRLGPYEILSALGAGGMGDVYKAHDPRLARDVAIKVLPPSFAADASRLWRFEQEARAVAALSHPNILAIFDIGSGETPYLVTELLDGETLRALVNRGAVAMKGTTDIALQLVAGLAAAHGRGIVHRDLKPENIFLTRDGVVKILDFGLAKAIARSLEGQFDEPEDAATIAATTAGLILGTAGYMAPEQVRGETVDPRADIFAVGTILYEMVSGQRAFQGKSPADTMSAVLRESPPDLPLRTGTPPAFARIVRRCLEKDPSERFQTARDLRFAIESLSDVKPTAPEPAKKTDEKSIAVLPFVNMSADADNQYFSDGLAEDLINALTGLPGLHVASRTSSFRFRGRDADITEIGTQLHVATVLEGSVRRAGSRLRITAQLTSVADGYHLWSERYDREMADVFAIQDEIVAAIVKAIAPALAGAAKTAVKRPTQNVDAYELYLNARHYWRQRVPAAIQLAVRLFEQVIALDPEYALAHTGLADCYSTYRVYGWFPADTVQPPAREAIARAMALDPGLAEVQVAQALYTMYFERHWRAAIDQLRRAIALNPRLAVAHAYLGACYACDRRVEEARAACERGCDLEPLSPLVHHLRAASLYMLGRFAEAEDAARRVLDLQPDLLLGRAFLGSALLGLGRFDEAVEAAEVLLSAGHQTTLWVGIAGLVYAKAGRTADARRLLAELDERAIRGEYIAPWGPLAINVGLGDVTEIRRLLEMCVIDRTPPLSLAAASGRFLDAYRNDPEINRLVDVIFDITPPSASARRLE